MLRHASRRIIAGSIALGLIDVRAATLADLDAIRHIYNDGVEERIATLDTSSKTVGEIAEWWDEHDERFIVLVAIDEGGKTLGWASLNRFSHRCAHDAIADLSVYVARSHRGRGVGTALLSALDIIAEARGFHKIVLHALNRNEPGKRLYESSGFAVVGIFKDHGIIDGQYVDVIAMEKILGASV